MSTPKFIKENPIYRTLAALGALVALVHSVPGWAEQIRVWAFQYPAVGIFIMAGLFIYILMKLNKHDNSDSEVRARVSNLENKVDNSNNLLILVAKKLGIDDETIEAIVGRKDTDAPD